MWYRVFLALYLLQREQDQAESVHVKPIEFVLQIFGKTLKDVVAIVGDNCTVNQAISRLSDLPFVGCVSGRFNFSVIGMRETLCSSV